MSVLSIAVGAAAAVLAWAEFVHRRASGRLLGRGEKGAGSEAIVVLGFRNRGDRANYVNRYRVRAAVRSIDPSASTTILVLCGGAVAGEVTEAELMRRYAQDELGYAGPLQLETASRTTWDNVVHAIPLIEDADSIKIVSNSLHAERGRAHLWKLRPDLGDRLRRADDYHFGESVLLKAVAAIVGLTRQSRPAAARTARASQVTHSFDALAETCPQGIDSVLEPWSDIRQYRASAPHPPSGPRRDSR